MSLGVHPTALMSVRPRAVTSRALPKGEVLHRVVVWLLISSVAAPLVALAIYGAPYYSLSIEQRPYSPLHPLLRSSGTIGLKLGILGAGMFCILFLYPLRKRLLWLSRIGQTRRWLRVHVLFGIATPLVVTFHTAFKWHGLAGLAYFTMVAVALSGFVGRYVYAKIPRGLNSVQIAANELEAQTAALAARLHAQHVFTARDLAPLLRVPAAQEIRKMNFIHVLGTMLRIDLCRPFLVRRLRRRVLSKNQRITTLGGWLASHDANVESIVASVRRQARLCTGIAFLDRTQRIFYLWHVIHRPFSVSFVILIVVHVSVVLLVGLR